MELIDIKDAKKKKAIEKRKKNNEAKKPNANLRCMIDGKEWFTYSIRYAYEGKNWTIDMIAKSEKDAWGRLLAMRNFPVEINQIYAVIPA